MSAAVGGAELPRRARGVAGLPEWFVTRQPIVLAVLVLAVVAVPQTSLVIQRLVQNEPQAGPVTLIVWGLYAVPLLAAILTVDYFEREPWWLVALALVWGGLIATGLALSANSAVQSILTTTEGVSFTTQWGAAIAGPTDEEILKGLGVVVCALLASRRMRSPVDGFILGAVVGLGFQVVEDIVYTANVMATGADPWSALWEMFLLRGIMAGLWSHAVYTGLFGLGLGYALTRPDWPRGRRVLAVVAGFAAAWTLHFLWNSPLIVDSTDWRLVVVKGLPALLLLLALLQRAQRADSAVFLPALAAVGDPMVASGAEIAALADRRSRHRARSEARATGGWRAAHAERRLQRAHADLAVALSTGDSVGVERAREEVAQARYLLGHLPHHPPVLGRTAGTWSIVLCVGGLFVPIVGVVAVVVAIVGLVRARAAARTRPGASVSARLWIGLALGIVAIVLVAIALSQNR
ncbi:MAG: PrsW family intramembrane metalloprotease [Kineosporiaceae bacterium]